jgi:SAM-dependent methyltransferase
MMFGGSGPGEQALDGCSVELYRRLPYLGELDFLPGRVPSGASILELGCGVGRLTKVLLSLGLRVTAVDNSAGMLAHCPDGATLIKGDIETLRLERTFDAVLLASCLINIPFERTRDAFLRTARCHLETNGLLLFERQSAAWLNDLVAGWTSNIGEIVVTVEEAVRDGDQLAICLAYKHGGSAWRHRFAHAVLNDEDVNQCLKAAGFREATWIDQKRRWGAVQAC